MWHSSSRESNELGSDNTSGGEGSGWQEVADGNHIQARTTFQYNEVHGPKRAPSQDAHTHTHTHTSVFFTVQLVNEFVKQTNNYATNFLQAHTDLPHKSRARKWKNVTV